MSYRDFAFNWRATMGNAEAMPADVAELLDLVSSLVEDDGFYRSMTACYHTCASDDPIVLLDHVRRQKMCISISDYRLYDRAVAAVRQHRTPFYCDGEVERRMQQADGACPMCGFEISFYTGDYGDGYQPQMTHCQHNLGHKVKQADIHGYLRQARSWQGGHWPYAWMQGSKMTRADGTPFTRAEDGGRMPCYGCMEMEAYERMEKAIHALAASVGEGAFTKPGWGSPVSEYACKGCPACHDSDEECGRVYMHVKRTLLDLATGFNNSGELRLNGAGLKLYMTRPRQGRFGRQPSYAMRVGGDQAKDYPGFVEHAHALFAEHGVPSVEEEAA